MPRWNSGDLVAGFIVLVVAILVGFFVSRPESDKEQMKACGDACHVTNAAMLSYSKEQGCVCLHQGPL